jgi:exodeoxyribonuclease VII large subunit
MLDKHPLQREASILTVSELNRMARKLIEENFPPLWVTGEISNLTKASSGHWYFSIKDQNAQVRCAMFRTKNSLLDWTPKEGDHVDARALVTLYEAQGSFQLMVENMRLAGTGSLFEAFEALKHKLEQEGLFEPSRKRALPSKPKAIGIVTSIDAAALRDVLATLNRRMPSIPIIIYPTLVQGKGACQQIAHAINEASQRQECDVLIICRGGGSLEDLWEFNEEVVARSIAACTIPTISGVGHETDFTICDFVADVRAPTPTAAAELCSPDRLHLISQLKQIHQKLLRNIQYLIQQKAQHIDYLSKRLISPAEKLERQSKELHQLSLRFQRAFAQKIAQTQLKIEQLSINLNHLNPDAILKRGFAYAQDKDGNIVTRHDQIKVGDTVNLTLSVGHAKTLVKQTQSD